MNDDGNVYDPENIISLTELVMKVTGDKGVHFMMADGVSSIHLYSMNFIEIGVGQSISPTTYVLVVC